MWFSSFRIMRWAAIEMEIRLAPTLFLFYKNKIMEESLGHTQRSQGFECKLGF